MLGHFGIIPRILTMIPGLGRSEVVIIYPDKWDELTSRRYTQVIYQEIIINNPITLW